MKFNCHCGALLIDQSDALPHKAYLIADQDWFTVLDGLDEQVIDPLSVGKISGDAAAHRARTILTGMKRSLYQCRDCGRIYINDTHGDLHCYAPQSETTSREILRTSRNG